jgi:AmiR/NasT family two-component response regulator
MSFRILIADDERLQRMDLKELLEELGYQVVAEAKNGMEALDLLKQERPDVVILDIKMPRMDGIEVAKEVSREYPVIMLTAYSESQLIQKARDAGAMAYLTKPFRKRDISPTIEMAVSHFLEKSALTERVSRLREQLETRKVVERAKGLLMKNESLSEPKAYRRLQEISMDKNIPMKEVAEAVITMLE